MIDVQLPIGRLLSGNVYHPEKVINRKTREPVIDKNGSQREVFKIVVGIPKGSEGHWAETEWGAKIYNEGAASFPNQYRKVDFSWKIHDGDSPWTNDEGEEVEMPERKGLWVVRASRAWAPLLIDMEGKTLAQEGVFYPGCYVQLVLTAQSNNSPKTPGLYINPEILAFAAHGERISFSRVDVSAYKFGGALPPGASATPVGNVNVATPTPTPHPPLRNHAGVNAPTGNLTPNYAVLQPPPAPVQPIHTPLPPPVPQGPVMTDKAVGPYDAYIKAGWTDELLRQNGLMV
jgi:hypothetical protein